MRLFPKCGYSVWELGSPWAQPAQRLQQTNQQSKKSPTKIKQNYQKFQIQEGEDIVSGRVILGCFSCKMQHGANRGALGCYLLSVRKLPSMRNMPWDRMNLLVRMVRPFQHSLLSKRPTFGATGTPEKQKQGTASLGWAENLCMTALVCPAVQSFTEQSSKVRPIKTAQEQQCWASKLVCEKQLTPDVGTETPEQGQCFLTTLHPHNRNFRAQIPKRVYI